MHFDAKLNNVLCFALISARLDVIILFFYNYNYLSTTRNLGFLSSLWNVAIDILFVFGDEISRDKFLNFFTGIPHTATRLWRFERFTSSVKNVTCAGTRHKIDPSSRTTCLSCRGGTCRAVRPGFRSRARGDGANRIYRETLCNAVTPRSLSPATQRIPRTSDAPNVFRITTPSAGPANASRTKPDGRAGTKPNE